jgi:hypothetical protein
MDPKRSRQGLDHGDDLKGAFCGVVDASGASDLCSQHVDIERLVLHGSKLLPPAAASGSSKPKAITLEPT